MEARVGPDFLHVNLSLTQDLNALLPKIIVLHHKKDFLVTETFLAILKTLLSEIFKQLLGGANLDQVVKVQLCCFCLGDVSASYHV
jgi:hypothetical protein